MNAKYNFNATTRDVYVDPALSQMAIGYRPDGFIADMIFPTVPVLKQGGIFYRFSREDRLRRESAVRAPGTEAKIVTEDLGTGTYYAVNYALKRNIPIEDKENSDPIVLAGLINGASTYVLDKLLLDKEFRVANLVTSTSNVGSSAAVASAWNGAGAPLSDMNQALDNVHDSTGKKANRVVMGLAAWRSFRRDATVRNLIFGTNNGGGYPSTVQAANLLDIESLYVGGAFQNTGEEMLAESLSQIWGDNVLCYHAPAAPTIETPSLGYFFRWKPNGVPDMQVERHPYDSRKKSEEVEVGFYEDEKITGSDYGFLLTAVNSST